MNEDELSIQDLCEQTGVPRRTIHFYIQQEILPPPMGSGLAARYGREHLLRLKLIPILRQQGLKLDDIRQKYKTASLADLERISKQLVADIKETSAPPGRPSINGTPYQIYTLPSGVVIMIPNHLSTESRQKAQQLLQTAQLLFQPSSTN